MIPDTFAGGLILSVVNMVIVFAVLIIIAFVINLIYRSVSNAEGKQSTEAAVAETAVSPVKSSDVEQAGAAAEKVAFDSLDSHRKAAITAALCAYLGHHAVPVFVRRIPDAGAWGKSSRIHAIK
ncbi:MAG TPA: OadG family protein [Firmicutes bacterium]|nr:OadG family protein [Candidatus Fermentithermobacillaceae bacterium]